VNLTRAIVACGFWGLAASLPVNAQQAASPVSAGSPGVATLRLETYVKAVYPQIAQSARVSGEVVLDATIGPDGRPSDLRVLRSIPLLDQAAIDAVRQWRFGPPAVGGASASVRVPISLVFQHRGGSPPLAMSPAVAMYNPSLPRDFAVVFASSCPDGGEIYLNSVTGVFENRRGVVSVRVNLLVGGAPLDQIHEVITRTELMSDSTRVTQWPTVTEPEVSDSRIRVLVFPGEGPGISPPFIDWSSGRPPRQFLVDVRMNGMWTRLFPPASWPSLYPPSNVDPRDGQLEKGARQIARLLEKQVQSFDVVRKLPRDQQWCRWPD
jgi:TonB family protein